MKSNQSHPIKIILKKQNQIKFQLDQRILKFGLPPLQHEDYTQPLYLPLDVVNTQLPLQIVSHFASAHNYNPGSPKIKLPLSSNNYKQVVDPITFEICYKYTNLDLIDQTEQILRFAKWIQFKQLEQAIAAAIAVNYYTSYDQKQVDDFMKRNNLQNITPEQIQQILEQNKQIFDYVELKTKQQFVKETEHTIKE